MRWNSPRKKPLEVGDTRVVKRFLFFPKRNPKNTDEVRWLEFVFAKQERIVETRYDYEAKMQYYLYVWKTLEWVDHDGLV